MKNYKAKSDYWKKYIDWKKENKNRLIASWIDFKYIHGVYVPFWLFTITFYKSLKKGFKIDADKQIELLLNN